MALSPVFPDECFEGELSLASLSRHRANSSQPANRASVARGGRPATAGGAFGFASAAGAVDGPEYGQIADGTADGEGLHLRNLAVYLEVHTPRSADRTDRTSPVLPGRLTGTCAERKHRAICL